MQNNKPLRVLIAGGGIAGPALAFWLHRLGHSITIIERWDTLRIGGQQIDLRLQGVEAAERMGILDEIREHVVDEAGVDLVNEKGQSVIFFPRHEPGSKEQGFSSEFEIMRGDLCRILYGRTKEDVNYRFGLSVNSFESVGDVVNVTLSDGSVEEYDLLVGADGQGSRIRRAMNKDEEGGDGQFLRGFGAYMCYFPIKRTAADEGHATCYVETERRIVMTRWHKPDLGQVYLMTMKTSHNEKVKEALGHDVATQKEALAKVFSTMRWEQRDRILDALNTTEDFYAHEIIQVRDNKLTKGRVALLGDAGFCPSVFSGMGTSAALVGAYILAGEIGKCKGDVEAGLAGYDATLRPFIGTVQVLNASMTRLIPESAVGLRMLNFFLWLAGKLNVFKLLQARAVEKKEDWVMPRYEELHVGGG
ncbi:hypothetical protein C2857_000532 [Epichloe festucae Fl1]|uniref:FAD-binding domain-containing protein n=1 Tax=Epichloe festucae (strain Fl1) TaxID=877507 RepID=A0A7S9PRG8_EPIFF|nr:hypothetical protein C2857_000532 [Epichloe festucae Fl1]